MTCLFKTGLLPDRAERRALDAQSHPFAVQIEAPDSDPIVQSIAWIRDQRVNPSCAGQAPAAIIDAARLFLPWASAVSIWREARRRQGRIEQIDLGTRFEYVISGLVHRGWDPYVLGEDGDLVEAGLGAPPAGDDLQDELFADDKRGVGMRRYRISAGELDAVDAALINPTLGVMIGTGTRDAYHAYQGDPSKPDAILTTDHLGGDRDGHGQRVFARVWQDGRRIYGIQGSWGPDGAVVLATPPARATGWGGIHLPDGRWAPGCCWVDERVLREAWDIHVIEPRV